ncbi:unnamed protein product [Clonostachys rhizophaga]|uniref:AMP-dependent synthetase/ligase domain-containing protein n=1 Tax=Clonostachys rhizophaga TaxID=160324 RepID=A0A9N9VRN0_9HYPO|nr:unnamed protein product [Clonostachys rhizophaga]
MAPPMISIKGPSKKAAIAASSVAAALFGAVYANNHYGVTYDINQLRHEKAFQKCLAQRIQALGGNFSLHRMLELADREAEALWFEGRRWTFAEILLESTKLAALLQERGIVSGDTVAFMTSNSPEMIVALAAVSKLGAVPALINTALRNHTLQHCLDIVNAKLMICTPDLVAAIVEEGSTTTTPPILSLSLSSFPPLQLSPETCANASITVVRYEDLVNVIVCALTPPKRLLKDVGVLVYTSGTSGKPKAVAVKNFLLVLVSTTLPLDAKKPRTYLPLRTYSCLPLFHATALFTGVYYSAGISGSLCLARKFSASQFSNELVKSGATRMLYVGELCRYLLRAPNSPNDRAHKCIVAMGNGLSADVWRQFVQRFNILEVREIYRSTEGVAKFDNYTRLLSGAGKVGYAGPVKARAEDTTFLVKYDTESGALYRDPKTGFCVPAKADEPGEAIGRVRSKDLLNNYHNNEEATQAKLVSDVFEKGDLFQRTGDLLVRQSNGWIRFHDRTGDTFRWRGENVSASEVREHIEKLDSVKACSAYAVKLPGYDGQAGAAAITLVDPSTEDSFTSTLFDRLQARGLALYQMPRLIRFRASIDTTATFKQSSAGMKTLSWDPEENQGDKVYWLNGNKYRQIDTTSWTDIKLGKARL